MHRALPDARDGLKPVHRRILWAMRRLRLTPTGGFLKSAKISGDTMGDFHPHGDQAIYDAMARLAQDFNMRYPLVDGQGNFGNIDGDNPAASRYTEARVTAAAEALMEGIDETAVDFRPNYDGRLEEPVVLPAAFPNLLANGSSGIAVGMATNIPPHNLDELIDGCQALLADPDLTDEALVALIPGPDFPTGGVIVEPRDSILEAYRHRPRRLPHPRQMAGRGSGPWHLADRRHRNPLSGPEVQADRKAGRAYPDQEGPPPGRCPRRIRRGYPPDPGTPRPHRGPRGADGQPVPNSDLEQRFSLNMNVLIDGKVPKVCSLKEVLRAFLDHRRDVLQRRSRTGSKRSTRGWRFWKAC
jgi:topoisomerase-4 subunit A